MMEIFCGNRVVTGLCTELLLEQHMDAAAARLELCIVHEDGGFLPVVTPACGDPVRLQADGRAVFTGRAYRVESTQYTTRIVAYDNARLLAVNEVMGVFCGSVAQIGAAVCSRVGLTLSTAPSGGNTTIVSQGGLTALAVLRRAAGEDYYITCENDQIALLPKGSNRASLGVGAAVLALSHGESIEAMVNKAQIVSTKGHVLSQSRNDGHISRYGQMSRYYQNTGASATAQSKLRGVDRRCRLTVLGNFAPRCGMTMPLSFSAVGVSGDFLIEAVTHRVEGGLHTTTLQLIGRSL